MAKILISGGTGLVGTNLTRHLLDRKHEAIILTREKNRVSDNPKISYSFWDTKKGILDADVIKKADHIIHLAGAGVMDKKWTEAYKKEIVDSRTTSTALFIKALKENENKVQTFVSASAIGYYGEDSKPLIRKEGFIETDLPSADFLGETCVRWEASSEPVKSLGIKLVKLRTGIVLANEGGALKEYKLPLKFGFATIFGNGKQAVSWIHIDDLCRMYCDAFEQDYFSGVYNATAPEIVSQKKMVTTYGEKLKNKFYTPIHVPMFALKLLLGQRSVEILKSATVCSKKVKTEGFTFLYPTLDAALEELSKK